MDNRCPPVKGFRFSSPTSVYKQDVLFQRSTQISSSGFIISGFRADVEMLGETRTTNQLVQHSWSVGSTIVQPLQIFQDKL